jgi:hypothetical protein
MTVEHTVYEGPEPKQTVAESTMADTQAVQAVAQHGDTQHPSAPQSRSTEAPRSANFAPSGDTQEFPLHGPEATQPSPIMGSETTINLRLDGTRIESTRVEPTRLDYNLLDLDMTAAQHVNLPSELHEPVLKERRKNLADVLKLAIEREPERHDLRMKLLECYYSAASTNRQGFLEVVQKFAHDRDLLEPGVWDKIAFMGRQIAAENPLFAETAADDDLADCA